MITLISFLGLLVVTALFLQWWCRREVEPSVGEIWNTMPGAAYANAHGWVKILTVGAWIEYEIVNRAGKVVSTACCHRLTFKATYVRVLKAKKNERTS